MFLGNLLLFYSLLLQASAAPEPGPEPEPEPGVNIGFKVKINSNGGNNIGPQTDVKCGIMGPHHTRIVNGQNVTFADKYSWQVGLSMEKDHKYDVKCGGSIITNKHILTAADCLPINYIGFDSNEIDKTVVFIPVERVYVNEYFDVFDYDIAIIELRRRIDLVKYGISPICLPTNDANDYTGSIATVTGWGSTVGFNPTQSPLPQPHYPNILQEAQVPVISNTECEKEVHWLTEEMLCVGNLKGFEQGDKDSCKRDIGGPLIIEVNGQYQQIGIVSDGNGCASKGHPGVYTRVTKFLDWIDNII